MRTILTIESSPGRYGAGIAAALAGVGIAALLESQTGAATYAFPLAGIMLAAFVGGLGPAFVAFALGAATTNLTLIDDPFGSFAELGHPDVTRWFVFLAACGPVIAVGCAARWALTRESAARRNLERARAGLALALDAGRMGTWGADTDTKSFVCSPEACELLGAGANEQLTSLDDFVRLLHPDDRDAVVGAFVHSSEWGAGQDVQARLVADAHDQRWVLIRGRLLTGTGATTGIVVDISTHKRAEMRAEFLARLGTELVLPTGTRERMETLAILLSTALGEACVVRLTPPGEPALAAAAVDGRVFHADGTIDAGDPRWPAAPLGEMLGSSSPPHVSAPLVVRGRSIGAVAVARRDPSRPMGHDDEEMFREAVGRAAVAIENARLFERHRMIAETLQRSLLPPELPPIADMELAAAYDAAGEGDVGGDFYDAFETAKGCWVVAIGDVCGKGTEAASLTALARHTMRVAALADPVPSRILASLNMALRGRTAPDRAMMTAVCVLIDRRPGEMAVTLARAGHPPPFLVQAGSGLVTPLEPPGPMLGVFEDVVIEDLSVVVADDDFLVLYTDGVTETRGDGEFFGMSRLEDLLAHSVGLPAPQVVDRIESETRAFRTGAASDDSAILVLRRAQWTPIDSVAQTRQREGTAVSLIAEEPLKAPSGA